MRAFDDLIIHKEIVFLALVSIVDAGGDFRVEEAIGKIKSADGFPVVANQALAEAATESEGSGLQSEAALRRSLLKYLLPLRRHRQGEKIAAGNFVADDAKSSLGIVM